MAHGLTFYHMRCGISQFSRRRAHEGLPFHVASSLWKYQPSPCIEPPLKIALALCNAHMHPSPLATSSQCALWPNFPPVGGRRAAPSAWGASGPRAAALCTGPRIAMALWFAESDEHARQFARAEVRTECVRGLVQNAGAGAFEVAAHARWRQNARQKRHTAMT